MNFIYVRSYWIIDSGKNEFDIWIQVTKAKGVIHKSEKVYSVLKEVLSLHYQAWKLSAKGILLLEYM